MIRYIRKSRFAKVISLTLAISLVSEVVFPTVAIALTGGPSQPEVESFAPIEATDMVDLFSGDFKYNIPLLEVDGYPININYNSNITMDQEGSWVGLGWNLNPGVINRSMRGLPDEFSGDKVTKEFNIAKDETYGVTLGIGDVEVFGVNGFDVSANLGVKWNSIQGMGIDFSVSPTISLGELATWTSNKIEKSGYSKAKKEKLQNICKRIKKYSDLMSKVSDSKVMQFAQGGIPFLRDLELGKTLNGISRNPISYIKYGVLNKTPTFTPEVQSSMRNNSETYNGKVGGSFIGIDGNVSFTGYHSVHEIIKAPTIVPAYGYMNTDLGMTSNGYSLLDFNRENDGSFSEDLAYLPLTNYTYDSYSILGQGLTGAFRAHRGAVDVLFDQTKYNLGESSYLGAEVAPGNIIHVGVDESSNKVYGVSGLWVDNNYALPALVKNYYGQSKDFEKAYFKESGEMNVEENYSTGDFYKKIGENSATKLQLTGFVGGSLMSNMDFFSPNSDTKAFSQSIQREKRAKRLTYISYLNPKEASIIGINKEIQSYPLLRTGPNAVTSNGNTYSAINRISRTQRSDNHISEITVTKTDGSRYVYGIPVYNLKQVESSFNVDLVCCQQQLDRGMVLYNPQDDSYDNDCGKDHYYNKTILPPFPHSYLLTAVLSPDYIDLTGDGPTEDDLGGYVKYNYSKLDKKYNWRSPLSTMENMASYSEGQKHTKSDDRGNYTYGEKEVWYLQSIETKNQIAEFYLSDRYDGCGVENGSGKIDYTGNICPFLKKLDKISLYSKRDRQLELINPQHKATPIKEVHFVYNYSLCKNIPNSITKRTETNYADNEKGKLTLKQIYFTYGNSHKGKFNSYKFNYDEDNTVSNPDYDNKAYDRWGNYMSFNGAKFSGMKVMECPYVNQSKVSGTDDYKVDKWSSVWSLRTIVLPSGGEINIEYEADDYAYVQNKQAMEMYQIAGVNFGNITDYTLGLTNLHNKVCYGTENENILRVYFKLSEEVQNSTYTDAQLLDLYFDKMEDLYFSCFMRLDTHHNKEIFERVNGYAKIRFKEIKQIGQYKYGVLWLDNVRVNNEDGGSKDYTNPFTKAGINYCLNNAPYIVSEDDYPDDSQSSASMNFASLISEFSSILNLFNSDEDKMEEMIKNDRCNRIDLDKSWIKVNNPLLNKKGGGSRVKEIRISDGWTGEVSEYGQQYSYTKEEIIHGEKMVISSGVAANEPGIGDDENVLKTAICKNGDKKYLSWEERGYIEGPIGESFYPGAGVGYSKVTVMNLPRAEGGKTLTKHATGKVIHEFFTARDFPVRVTMTPLDVIPTVVESSSITSSTDIKRMAASQGYAVDCNDMHGKQKAVYYYPEGAETPISGEKYIYQTNAGDGYLDNTVDYIKKDGKIEKGLLGVDIDFITDFRNSFTSSSNSKLKLNTATFIVFIPIPIPTAFGTGSYMERAFKTSSVTKVISRRGILKEVQKFDASSYVSSKNLVYDYETGEVLETQTNNEFDDPQYSFSYPAHWAYNQMDLAYKNSLLSFKKVNINNGIWDYLQLTQEEENRFFVSGDEVLIYPGTGNPVQAWILDIDRTQKKISLIDKYGNKIPDMSDVELKILRSGRKNLATTSIGSITSLSNPIVYNDVLQIDDKTKVLTASATEYNNVRKMFCNEKEDESVCIKSISTAFSDLVHFLNKMIEKNSLIKNPAVPLNQNNYASIFNAGLRSGLGFTDAVTYFGNATSNTVTIRLNDPVNAKMIELNIPVNNASNVKIVKFSNLRVKDQSCNTKSFLLDIEYIDEDGKTLRMTTSEGTSNTNFTNDPLYAYANSLMCNSVNCKKGINPYTQGMFVHWYPYIHYVFLSKRVQNILPNSSGVNTRIDGYLENFFPFWYLNATGKWSKNPGPGGTEKWVKQSAVTIVDPQGVEVENKDALNIYSSAIFGFNSKLAVAIAKNARKNEIGYEGFEDKNVTNLCNSEQVMFRYLTSGVLSTDFSHTGRYSMKLPVGYSLSYTGKIEDQNTEIKPSVDYLNTDDDNLKDEFIYDCADCMKTFSLRSDAVKPSKYLLSFWVKDAAYNPAYSVNNPVRVSITINGVTTSFIPAASSLVEGWQKVELSVNVPVSQSGQLFDISIISNSSQAIYLDDIRIHPYNASMKSYVYNDITLKLMAELDENNYATFYEYDEEGALSRIKKETEKGVFTIKEIRKSFKKKDLTLN